MGSGASKRTKCDATEPLGAKTVSALVESTGPSTLTATSPLNYPAVACPGGRSSALLVVPALTVSSPRLLHDSFGTSPCSPRDSRCSILAAASGGGPLKYGREYIGEEIELPSDGTDDTVADDFALASTHSARGSRARTSLAAVQSSGGGGRLASTQGSGRKEGASGRAERGVTFNALDENAEVLEFVSFGRPGLRDCHVCGSRLPHRANFCPQCGSATVVSMQGRGSAVTLSPRERDRDFTAFSAASESLTVSSCLATPAWPKDDGVISFSASPTTSELPLSPRSASSAGGHTAAAAARRRAYRRRVKIISGCEKRGLLGSGANGKVFKAIDIDSGQQLAVKEMCVNPLDDSEIAAIRNELRHLSNLRHRNVIEYLGCSTERLQPQPGVFSRRNSPPVTSLTVTNTLVAGSFGDAHATGEPDPTLRVCILMERMECGTLEDLLKEFPDGMPESTARGYVMQLVDAISYVHGRGVTHRDIKPSNILLASDGTIKLSDFGCAVVMASCGGAHSPHTSQGSLPPEPTLQQSVAGTPAYMPPEALSAVGTSGEQLALFNRAQDVWAVGCVAHQLLTGKVPWASVPVATPFALLLHIQDASEFPVADSLPPEARDFCECCCARDPATRADLSRLLRHPFLF